MFFIGIFGIENKEKEIKDIKNVLCNNCGSLTSYKLIKTYTFFHIFFIPLFKWNKKYFLISRCCNNIWEIPLDIGGKLEGEGNVTMDFNQFENITKADDNYKSICPVCGSNIHNNYVYCPFCGSKIN
ncbi:hypothetical protein Q428_02015 [Fervidicella metallireducens AeB]|uniref:Zinc-ribbon 15 domain-containing protein n=1 Tax=Fervidicella metallireducens AeB TaxID=1403537 RepID=A0A017S092_9CLOT|nr:zinc ribbon domain-containing protein [Fervidicella metallireducens]EYE89570.1 hypothetical protein Q428_02015 [Fervidicella metallireducens AeB]